MEPNSQPTLRPTGRILLVDPADRILLMRIEDDTLDEPILWITPGGACEETETPEQAALRELREETGIQSPYAGPCVWHRRHVWRWGERIIESIEHFHFLRINGTPDIKPAATTAQELGVIREYRWWTVPELQQATTEVFVPRRLPQLLPQLLAGEAGGQPIDVGI